MDVAFSYEAHTRITREPLCVYLRQWGSREPQDLELAKRLDVDSCEYFSSAYISFIAWCVGAGTPQALNRLTTLSIHFCTAQTLRASTFDP
jgi:hypothetical protein